MSRPDPAGDDAAVTSGATTGVGGTPFAVDLAEDRRDRIVWVVFLAGPVTWLAHFVLVYLVAEAGCTGGGPGLEAFDPPVPTILTLATTVVAALGCLWSAAWAWRRWRTRPRTQPWGVTDDLAADLEQVDRDGLLAFAGFMLSVLSFVAVLLVGLPDLTLPAC